MAATPNIRHVFAKVRLTTTILTWAALAASLHALCFVAAAAETPEACPPGAEQRLFNARMSAASGQKIDMQRLYAQANAALRACADRTEVQGLAVEILVGIGQTPMTPENRFTVFTQAYQASLNNAASYTYKKIEVDLPNGEKQTLFTYARVGMLLRGVIIPNLMGLADKGFVHDMFSPEPLQVCPYSHNSRARIRDEAEALRKAVDIYRDPALSRAAGRMERLRAACPDEKGFLTWELAGMYEAAAGETVNARDKRRDYAKLAMKNIQAFSALNPSEKSDVKTYGNSAMRYANMQRLAKELE